MAISSRQKGVGYETKICNLLNKITGRTFVRSPGSGAVATRTGNTKLAGDIIGQNFQCDYVFECKKYKEYNLEGLITQKGDIWKWFLQLEKEKGKRPGVLIFSRNYGKNFVLAEYEEDIKGTMRYGNYILGLFDQVMPIILEKYVKK